MEQTMSFIQSKNVEISIKRYLIDAMGSMALGLFASLLIGTIFSTLGGEFNLPWLVEMADYAKASTGGAMGAAISLSLQAPPLVIFSTISVGFAGNTLGGPVGAFIACIIATEAGKMVSKETKVDILVTPTVTILVGFIIAHTIAPVMQSVMTTLGGIINTSTELQPFLMGILVAVIMGMILTLPISSAALCIMLDLNGLAAGAATVGCCAQMVGFAVASYKENGVGGLVAQGIGTSMLQVPNIVKNPKIWLAPTIAAAITGPVATILFKLENIPVGAGMGTCGFVGPIGILTAMGNTTNIWIAIIVACIILPATLTYFLDKFFRKIGYVKDGDMKLDL